MADVLTELVAKISTDAAGLKKGLSDAETAVASASQKMQASLKNVGQSMANVGKQMSMKLTAPIVGLGAAAFKMSGDFDQAFRKTNVMLGASAEEAVNYKKRILEISSATGKTAGDVANAFYQIVSAGYRGADSIDILETAMKGAVGGAAQTESTMAALTKAMNIFGMEGVGGATKAMDIFFGIVDTGLLSFEQMASAFPQAASSAAGLGVSIEEVGAALGTLSKVTGSTDDAATALNNTFMQLIKPSDKMKDLYDEWGVTSGPEAIEAFGGLSGVLSKVAEATGGNVDELAELFPSIRALKAVLPLVTTNAEDYALALDTVGGSSGRTSEAFNEMAQGPGFQLNQTFTQIKNASIKLGDTLASTLSPILKAIGEKVEGLIQWWQNLDERWQKIIIVAVGILAAVGPVLIIFGQMAMAISFLIPIVSALAVAIMGVTWPVLAVIAGIAALIAIGVLVWKNWDTIKERAIKIWGAITDFFKDTWEKITSFFRDHWGKILMILFPAYGIFEMIKANWDKIKSFLQRLNPWEWIKEGWDKLTQGISNVLDHIFGHSIIENWVRGVSDFLGGVDLSGAGESMFGTLKDGITKSLDDTLSVVLNYASKMAAAYGITNSQQRVEAAISATAERRAELVASGMTPAEAARAASLETGRYVETEEGYLDYAEGITPGQYAKGGIFNQPTLGVIGEAGPEAVIPLNEMGSMGGVTVNFTQPVFFDREDTMNKFVDMIRKGIQRQDRLRFGGAYNG